MQSYPSFLLENAVNQLSKLPGVGKKSALRLALHLLKQDERQVTDFAQSILLMKTEIKYSLILMNSQKRPATNTELSLCSAFASESVNSEHSDGPM